MLRPTNRRDVYAGLHGTTVSRCRHHLPHIDQAACIVTHNACDSLKSPDRPWVGWVAYVEHPHRLGNPTTTLTPACIAN
jgi:hypothetical protein